MASTSVTTLIDLQMSRQTELEVLYRTVKEQESHTFNLAIVEMYLERLKEICGGVRRTHEEILTLKVDKADPYVTEVYTLATKLDPESLRAWESLLNERDCRLNSTQDFDVIDKNVMDRFPKIVELLQFLEQRARTLGAVARKTHAPKKEGTRAMRTIPGSRRVYHTTPSSSANVEIRCQGADHTLLHEATAHKSNASGPSAGNGSGETNKAEGQPSADFGAYILVSRRPSSSDEWFLLPTYQQIFLEGQAAFSRTRLSNNRSVMPLDVLGRTRATLKESTCFPWPKGPGNPLNLLRARDWGLQLFPMNAEFPVSASHKLALITSLPFVHTAHRYYRLNDVVRLPKGVYAGEALVENKNGKAYFKLHNTTSRFVSLKIPKLELLAYSIGTLPNLACDSYKSLSEIENSDLNECLHTLYNISKSTSADTSHTSKSPESPISPAPLRAVSVKKLLRLEHLNTEEAESVSKLIGKNADIFHLRGEPLSCTDILKHFFFINSIHHYNLSEDIW
ncbi:hypothetical protein M0802_015211 [Mischocyttarus mexicanus]|nr:hypothetical protein M0802_015211 [Mischocyttarus mexicanus]